MKIDAKQGPWADWTACKRNNSCVIEGTHLFGVQEVHAIIWTCQISLELVMNTHELEQSTIRGQKELS